MHPEDLLLLPQPKSVQLTGGEHRLAESLFDALTGFWPDAPLAADGGALREGAYHLELRPDSLELRAAGEAGRRNALATLAQLADRFGRTLPACVIDDAPDFAMRGVMLDVTRGRVPTMEHFRETIRTLAKWKINHIQLYFEHAFASPGNEKIWRDSSPITPDELREFDTFAASYGVELSVCQNSFGHLSIFLIDDDYRHLAEIAPGDTFDSWGQKSAVPQSLRASDPAALNWLARLYASLLPNYRGTLFNLGCDETLDLGCGRSRDAVRRDGAARVFADHVVALCRLAEPYGKQPAIWADMARKHPEVISLLPPELLWLVWGYEADYPFEEECARIAKIGRSFLVCPGTSCWSGFFGNSPRRRANLRQAAEAGLKYGADGMLITEWGDGGHRQFWPPTLLALADGAQSAWNAAAPFTPETAGYRAFGSAATGRYLEYAGDGEAVLRAAGLPTLWADMHTPVFSLGGADTPGQELRYRQMSELVEDLANSIPPDLPERERRELNCMAKLARIAAKRAIYRRQGRLPLLKALGEELERTLPEFRELWLIRSRPGGAKNAVNRYQAIANELKWIY